MKGLFLRGLNLLEKWYNSIRCALLGEKGIVLVFHEVSNDFEKDESCQIRVDTFKRIIERIASKYRMVSVEQFLEKGEKGGAVITFDDVPYSFYSEAYPILKEKQIPFTLFVAKKFVGQHGFLSVEDIKTLDEDPLCTIGAHTCNHTKLSCEQNSYSDIKESKDYLETLLGHPVKYMAYPYGRHDSVSCKNMREVKEAGFKAAFSTIQTSVPSKIDKYFIPRIELIK